MCTALTLALSGVGAQPLRGALADTAVWVASAVLAAYFFIGDTELVKSRERLARNPSTSGAAEALSAGTIKLISSVEVAGGRV